MKSLSISKTLFDLAKEVFNVRFQLEAARRDRRDRLAVYFGDIANLIESVSASLRIDKYPHGACAELEQRGKEIQKTLQGIVDPADALSYQKRLLSVWQIEQLFDQLQKLKPSSVERKLNELDRAAGYFRATAAHLRVSIS